MHPRIAFVAPMGTGKSQYAEFLGSTYGLRHISIAEPIKEIGRGLAPLFRLDPQDKAAMRPMLQGIGAGPRETDPDFWVRAMISKYDLSDSMQGTGYVVDDVRYPNEAEALQRVGFHVIRLEASEAARKARIQKRDGQVDNSVFDHETETAITRIAHDELLMNETEQDLERNFALLAARMATLQNIPSPEDSYVGEGI
jgi:dephospho-CoA kinase